MNIDWIPRFLEKDIAHIHSNVLLLGPRQVGKSQLLLHSLDIPPDAELHPSTSDKPYLYYNLLLDEVFVRLTRSPDLFRGEILARAAAHPRLTVIVDEIQRVPQLLNEIQAIVDFHKKSQIRFFITGSSTRKLKRGGANLLPGRLILKTLTPLIYREWAGRFSLERVLRLGALPGIQMAESSQRWDLLKTYTTTYLKEEIQAEGIVRQLSPFSRFLDIAALSAGRQLNMASISRDAGVKYPTIRHYFQILEDTLLGTLIYPYTGKTAKRLSMHPKFYLFDLGVRNAMVNLPPGEIPRTDFGFLFEQFMVLEILRLARYSPLDPKVYFWRTQAGAEVDCVIEIHNRLFGVEIKTGSSVSRSDLSGLLAFKETYGKKVERLMVAKYPGTSSQVEGISIMPWVDVLNELAGLFTI